MSRRGNAASPTVNHPQEHLSTCVHLFNCSPAHCEADIAMRKVATFANPLDGIQRVMRYEADAGTYLFLYTITEDGPCEFADWYETTAEAEAAAAESFGVKPDD